MKLQGDLEYRKMVPTMDLLGFRGEIPSFKFETKKDFIEAQEKKKIEVIGDETTENIENANNCDVLELGVVFAPRLKVVSAKVVDINRFRELAFGN